jgi:hypothetical protein
MRYALSLAGLLAAVSGLSLPASAAEDTSPTAPPPPAATAPAEKQPGLTPEEKAEKEARKACKAKICDIIATRNTAGEDVSCDIVKTWREEDIAKMLGGKIEWPWGKAVCQSKLELPRAPLAKAMSEPEYEIVMPQQKVRCTLAQKEKGEPYVVEVTMSPKVKFKDGRRHRQLGTGICAASHLPAHLCRRRPRQLDQCARAGGGAVGQRVRQQEMRRAQGRAPGRQTQLAACSKRLNQAS